MRNRWFVLAAMALLLAPRGVRAQAGSSCDSAACDQKTLVEFSLDPHGFLRYLRQSEIRKCAPCVLKGPFSLQQKSDAMIVLAELYLADHRKAVARSACLQVLNLDPCTSIDPALPVPLKQLFYASQDSLLTAMNFMCKSDFKTIAVGDIENNSQNILDLDMDKFCRGLQKILMNDLASATCLKVVDRDRLDRLVRERDLEPENAARIIGAQTYMFGSLLQVGKKDFVFTLRLDRTETTEVLLSKQLQQKLKSGNDILQLEKKVLLEHMVPQIQAMCEGTDTKQMRSKIERYFAEGPGQVPDYQAYVLKVGEAMLADEEQDLAHSRAAWAEVAQLGAFDTDAARRRDMLDSFAKATTSRGSAGGQ